jgi:hypothetical protein
MVRNLITSLAFLFMSGLPLAAQDPWQVMLSRMPLHGRVGYLNRTNAVETMLRAFQSNSVVKALIFMPGATDEFYMFRRAAAAITNQSPTLLDAVSALTNQTFIQATFRPPMLLLHTTEDELEPLVTSTDPNQASRLKSSVVLPELWSNDRDWNVIQPILVKALKADVRPWKNTYDSWHFYRHSLAAYNLSGWEALQAVARAGKSKVDIRRKSFPSLHRLEIDFDADNRFGNVPAFRGPIPGLDPRKK